MEDEDGYMALSPQPSNKNSARWAEAKRTQGNSKLIARYKISLGILGAACVVLGLAVIALIVFAVEGGLCKGETRGTAASATEDEAGTLKSPMRAHGSPCSEQMAIHLCEPFTESARCKLCPNNWVAREGKCYWFSKEKWNWLQGYSDCSRKRSQMLVVRDWAEMEFIQAITQEKYPVWIGLNITHLRNTWTWVEGSALNQTLFPLPLPETGAGCGVVKSGQVRSEMCTAEFRWICEKEAILF
ncbi:killer cell lectin-like receptor subfamily F member 1 [Lacerta agilis]|uniref:killer cell lectin-like receptor subfamily F member 1 n=1 Tax=Lacerta agilis TaxID=80427 RepID=UPI00141914B5|nr:killer cell lectin-like receptor subfamily F member 1 [Lacerta agilis]